MNKPIYIERQRIYSDRLGTFGPLGSISANGCGAVAIYNILEHFGKHEDFMNVIRRFERTWLLSMPFGGFLGTNIFYLYYCLRKYGFNVRPVFFFGCLKHRISLDDRSSLLVFYGWMKRRKFGAHYQAGFVDTKGRFVLHNPHVTYEGIEDMIRSKKEKEKMWFCMALKVQKTKDIK